MMQRVQNVQRVCTALARTQLRLARSSASQVPRSYCVAASRGLGGFPYVTGSKINSSSSPVTPSLLPRLATGNVRLFSSDSVVQVDCPDMGESITEGTMAVLLKSVGDGVVVDDVVGQIETDKVTLDVRSPYNGEISEFLIQEGDTIVVGQPLFKVDQSKVGATAAAAPADAPSTPAPAAKEAPAPPKPAAPAPTPPPKPAAAPAAAPVDPASRERRVPMSRLRRRVSDRLKQAQNTYAMLTTFNEVDMTNLMSLRSQYKDDFLAKHGVKLGFMSAFVQGAASALQEFPAVNGVIDGDDIVYRDYCDISIAVGTPKGLVVPVLRNVQDMGFADVEKSIGVLGEKARAGTLSIDDMTGGTFTISNGGVYGSLLSTPIINPPQSAIMGMHSVQKRPMDIKGEIKLRPMMYIALTYDHRLIDGREAVLFLRRVKDVVEDPRRLLLGV